MDAVRLGEHLIILVDVRHPVRKRLVASRLVFIVIHAWVTKQPLPLPFIVKYAMIANHRERQRDAVGQSGIGQDTLWKTQSNL